MVRVLLLVAALFLAAFDITTDPPGGGLPPLVPTEGASGVWSSDDVHGCFPITHAGGNRLILTDTQTNNTNSTTYTDETLDISLAPEHPNRVIVAALGGESCAGFSSVSINNQTAVSLVTQVSGGAVGGLFAQRVPTGDTVDIDVTYSGTCLRGNFNTWAIYTKESLLGSDTDSGTSGSMSALTIPANGIGLGFLFAIDPVSTAWSGLTEVWDNNPESQASSSGAELDNDGGGETTPAITATNSSSEQVIMGVAYELTPTQQYDCDTPVIEATATDNEESSSPAYNLPSGIEAGDLLLVVVGTCCGNAVSISGWSEIFSVSGDSAGTSARGVHGFYKIADGSEGSTVTASVSGGNGSNSQAWRISGAQVISGTATTSDGTTPDPPSHTPSWGDATLWIAVMNGRSTDISAWPSGYDDDQLEVSRSPNVWAASGALSAKASSQDPGTFTQDSDDNWAAATIAVQ